MKIIAVLVAFGLLFFPPEGEAAAIAILLFTFTGKSSAK
jgi:hypothetical protein